MFKVGVLYRTQDFLQFIKENPITTIDLERIFPTFKNVPIKNLLTVALKCGWISESSDGGLSIQKRGMEIINQQNYVSKLQMQLMDLVILNRPSWVNLVTRGRSHVQRYVDLDTYQCLNDAHLFESYDQNVVNWWDSLAHSTRINEHANNNKMVEKVKDYRMNMKKKE